MSNNNTITNCVTSDNLEGFWLDSSDNNRFENCKVEYTLEEGIQAKDSSNNIFYSCELMNIENGYAFYIQFDSDENLIYKCKISNNGVGVFFATNAEINGPSNNVVVFSRISDNIGAGVFFLGNGALIENTEIHYNNINGNKYGISAISSVNCFVYAQQNWWGSRFGPKIFAIGFGDIISWNLQNGRVYSYPWLKSPIEV
jgi:parallel beta-helix repeat protein